MNIDTGIVGFLALLGIMTAFGAWHVSRARRAQRMIESRGYHPASAPPADLVRLIAAHLGGQPRRAWRRDGRCWAIELLPRAEDEESTVRIVVTAPIATPFDDHLLLRSWQGASPEHLPGRLGTRLLEFGDERLAGLVRVPDPNGRLQGDGGGYLAYAEDAFELDSRLPDGFLERLPNLAKTAWSLVLSGPDLLLQAPFGRAAKAIDAVTELAARLNDTDPTSKGTRP